MLPQDRQDFVVLIFELINDFPEILNRQEGHSHFLAEVFKYRGLMTARVMTSLSLTVKRLNSMRPDVGRRE